MNDVSAWQIFWQNYWVRNLLIPAAVFLFFLVVSVPVTDLLFRFAKKANRGWGKKLEYGFRRPLRLLLAGTGLYLAAIACPAAWDSISFQSIVIRCFRSLLILVPAWGLSRMADSVELADTVFARKLDLPVDKALLPAISGVIRFLIGALAVLIVAQEWNFSISGLLAGLGLGGLAFALAAKDMLANLFGGFVILLDRPFSIGDWIRTGDVEGTVEGVNFRSVKVRTFGQAVVIVPNSLVTSGPVTNFSRMGKRKVDFSLCLEYGTPADRLKRCTEKIRNLLAEKDGIENGTESVALDGFGERGVELAVAYYTTSADYQNYLQVREDVFYSILKILESEKAELASPPKAVILENGVPPAGGT